MKTLEDILESWKPRIVNENDLQSGTIEFSYTGELLPLEIIKTDLQAEAIKSVKDLRKNLDYNLPFENRDTIGLILWIKHFFNLNEEDLK